MQDFVDFKIKKQLLNALTDMGIEQATPIQQESYSTILAGQDFVGISQTGTGKTIAFLLPILQDLKYSEEKNPRVLILVPTRELVIQIVEEIEKLTEYISLRYLGVYGGVNMNRQKVDIAQGLDILVSTPRRLYDLVVTNGLKLNNVKKLVIDEVDIMLDFGYKAQINNIFEKLPAKRQNILFSATMTTYVEDLIGDFLVNPVHKTISISGKPLDTITQECYAVPNFYTKANLLNHLLEDKEKHNKVLVFVASKSHADRLFENMEFGDEVGVIHAGKVQNQRTRAIDNFTNGDTRILIATDVISRGIDIEKISTVICYDVSYYPENHIHRIGRTGRAGEQGNAILFYTEREMELKSDIEALMKFEIPQNDFPAEVATSSEMTPEERRILFPEDYEEDDMEEIVYPMGSAFHEKKDKNKKVQQKKKSYKQQLKERYKKPIRRGDKIQNMKKKKRNKKR